jgi:general secretion pathway protein N
MLEIAPGKGGVGVGCVGHRAIIGAVTVRLKQHHVLSGTGSMKALRIALASLAAAFLALAALVWFMPARWALPLLQSRLHGLQFEQVDGTVWQGRAGRVLMPGGPVLGSLAWTLSRSTLLGDARLGLDLRQPQLQLQGELHRLSATQDNWHNVNLLVDMAMLGVQPWLHGRPEGELNLHVAQAQLQGSWPMQIAAAGTWSQAVVRTAQGAVSLGTMLLKINGQAGVLQAALDDDGNGPLQTAGRLSFSPLGWDLHINLRPRHDDPILLRWLRTLGVPAPDGSVRLRYRGGLAQFNSTTGNP